jgi:methylenetetrahydrofolate dehydrogenase (NADP+) / methenyltetrahydrofolate cyclohydrolase
MSAEIIDGKAVAASLEQELRESIARLAARAVQPCLVALRVGDDPASEVYVRNKARKAEELGLRGIQRHLPGGIGQLELGEEIDRLNSDDAVDGILLQLPLPSHLDAKALIDRIDPAKDVDGFHPVNVGNLHLGRKSLVPCTPAGVIRLIESTGQPIRGKHAVVIGRSDIVGKPVASLLLQRDATVTICHSRTAGLAEHTRRADIVVAAVGRPLMVGGELLRQGAIVVDVGINRLERDPDTEALLRHDAVKSHQLQQKGSVLVGDVDFAAAQQIAGWITPVPGGVGPMTIAMLMSNTVEAAIARRG